MNKVFAAMSKAFVIAFPIIANKNDNDKLREKLSLKYPQSILDDIYNSDSISIDTLKGIYDDTMHTKDRLEDKAKINIVGITIAITLIMGASNILTAIYEKYPYPLFSGIVSILFVFAVAYLFIAGILAIKVFVDENRIYVINLSSFATGETALREDYGECISQNQKQNLIRNNNIYTSYECIRNALICLFVVLVLSVIPYAAAESSAADTAYINDPSEYSFAYSSSAVDYIKDNDVQNFVEIAIKQAIDSGVLNESQTTSIGIIDSNDHLFIKYSVENNVITVWLVEPYITHKNNFIKS